ncbi:2Fe-2S ferredoxin [Povalibacter uvarum]|uniref:2Fe-2S ferredoxin n=1 Tax=Povalibacter uvarum TaxID=732238 RepID=A0A841HMX0_9GAMM|nr:2Fe-2S iron-sulfur cluster-binding protein [Povalibacter uvarum]MBB6093620.1 2Fe-2S ferredoxin [Povalibacter uvarum]
MPSIHVTDIYGEEHTVEAPAGSKLMEVLREYEFGVAASCGGFCSCATCHVYVDPAWIGKLAEMQYDERELVSILSTYKQGASRLSCQVPFTEDLDGIKVTVAPEE